MLVGVLRDELRHEPAKCVADHDAYDGRAFSVLLEKPAVDMLPGVQHGFDVSNHGVRGGGRLEGPCIAIEQRAPKSLFQ